jgi:hypothetical protein
MNNYIEKLNEMIQSGEIRTEAIQSIEVLHDEWCNALHGGDCNCDPEIHSREVAA